MIVWGKFFAFFCAKLYISPFIQRIKYISI